MTDEKCPAIVIRPGYGFGSGCVEGTGLAASYAAVQVVAVGGFKDTMTDFNLTRPQLLVACWWTATYAKKNIPKDKRKKWRVWARMAYPHLAACTFDACPNPPGVTA